MSKSKYSVLLLPLALFITLFAGVLFVDRVSAQVCSGGSNDTREACLRNLPPGQTYTCKDGSYVRVPASAPGGITADQACVNNGGAGTPSAQPIRPATNPFASEGSDADKQCGKGTSTYTPVIDLGCQGNDYKPNDPDAQLNPIMDVLFALLRFLTIGVGLVAIASVIFAGIQFMASRGDPAGTAKAIGRIGSTVGALFLYLIAWALLNWLVPGGVFNG